MNSVSESGTPPSVGSDHRSSSAGSSSESSSSRAISLMLVLSCLSLPPGLGAQNMARRRTHTIPETVPGSEIFHHGSSALLRRVHYRARRGSVVHDCALRARARARGAPPRADRRTATGCSARRSRPRTPCRRRCSAPGAASTASRAGRRCKSWLYRIATNVCLDLLGGRERRARPMDLGPAREPVSRT